MPRGRDGNSFPARLEPRPRAERALLAGVQDVSVGGVCTRRVDGLDKSLGMEGISKSQVSRIRAELDAEVARFRTRPVPAGSPCLGLAAAFVQVREAGRVVAQAVVIAVGVTADGPREILGVDIGPSEDGAFGRRFVRSLVARGLHGVCLVTSDVHEGLRQAIGAVGSGAGWQRCRGPFLRDALALGPQAAKPLLAATIRPVFAQPTAEQAGEPWRRVADSFRDRWPRLAEPLAAAASAVLADLACPREPWRQIWSTNPLERRKKEGTRRTEVGGICPTFAAATRLVGTLLAEAHASSPISRDAPTRG